MSERACLQCGQTPSQIKRDQTICGIEEGYEYRELAYEWPKHRWADWTDTELARNGIKPEAFDRHRRTDALTFQWIACVDRVRGHTPAKADDTDWGVRVGQCYDCGHQAEVPE